MIWIDIISLVCILILSLIGVWRGLLKSVFRLLAWVGAIVGAYFAQDLIGDTISSIFDISGFTVKLVCICIGFLVPFLLLSLLGLLMHRFVSGTAVSKVNRILGGLLGAFKGCLICFVFLSILHILPVSGVLKDARDNAVSYSAYKFTLEALGYSSDEIDLAKVAEEKASELTKEITDKAVEKAKDAAAQTAEGVKDAAVDATKNTVKKAKKKIKKKIDEDEIEYDNEEDIPLDE